MSLIVKALGLIDMIAAFVFLMLAFGLTPWLQLILFSTILLGIKGLFIFSGEPLSLLDLISSLLLLISIFFTLPTLLVWFPALLLLSKSVVSLI